MATQILITAEGELLHALDVSAEDENTEDEWETFEEQTSSARRDYAELSNVIVQLVRDGHVEDENLINPMPAY